MRIVGFEDKQNRRPTTQGRLYISKTNDELRPLQREGSITRATAKLPTEKRPQKSRATVTPTKAKQPLPVFLASVGCRCPLTT